MKLTLIMIVIMLSTCVSQTIYRTVGDTAVASTYNDKDELLSREDILIKPMLITIGDDYILTDNITTSNKHYIIGTETMEDGIVKIRTRSEKEVLCDFLFQVQNDKLYMMIYFLSINYIIVVEIQRQ
jgi:hypothetical protein